MHPKFRHFAAPFVITVAAACGSPQPQAQPQHQIISNPPPPMADAGPTEPAADAALPNMPEIRDPISGEPDPGAVLVPLQGVEILPAPEDAPSRPPLITANPPRQRVSAAMVISINAVADGVVVTINRGSAHGLAVGFTARVFDRADALLGEVKLTKVTTSRSMGKLAGVTTEQGKTAYRVVLAPP